MGNKLATVAPDVLAAWEVMRQKAEVLVSSGFLPAAIRTPEQAITIMQTGAELGLGPMQALRSIHVINGKPVMAAELMAALVYQRVPGAYLKIVKLSGTECAIHAARPGERDEPTEVIFTWEDAQRAGLTGKGPWKAYPRAMLRSRAMSEACRAVFPDAVMGVYTPEEMGADVDAEGNARVDSSDAVVVSLEEVPVEAKPATPKHVEPPAPPPEPKAPPPAAPSEPPPVPEDAKPSSNKPANADQHAQLKQLFEAMGVTKGSEKLSIMRELTGAQRVKDLTEPMAAVMIAALESELQQMLQDEQQGYDDIRDTLVEI